MRPLLQALTALLFAAPLAAAPDVRSKMPLTTDSLSLMAPEFTRAHWYQYLGGSLECYGSPVTNNNGVVFQRQEWYTLGKGNVFFHPQDEFYNRQIMTLNDRSEERRVGKECRSPR